MPVPLLIVAIETRSYSTARIPKALAQAGFDVALFAPHHSLAEKSRFVTRVGHLPDGANTAQWLFAFAAMAKATSPRIAIPGDDMALRLMHTLVSSPPQQLQPAMHEMLSALVVESLGDPAFYVTTLDPALLRPAAAALGVEVAPAGIRTPGGRRMRYFAAAWKGTLLAGWAAEDVVAHPQPDGPSTVVRRYRDPAAREAARTLIEGLGLSGLLSIQFVNDERTGRPLLLDIDRRIAPGIHVGAKIKVDLCAALLAAIEGRPSPSRTDLDEDETGYNVQFPQEWLRDPGSEWLRKQPVDVPWDEPELFEALLALRHER